MRASPPLLALVAGSLPSAAQSNDSFAGRLALSGDTATAVSNNLSATRENGTVVLSINAPPPIVSAASVNSAAATSFQYKILAANGPTSFGATNLPPGLSLNPVSGLPSATHLPMDAQWGVGSRWHGGNAAAHAGPTRRLRCLHRGGHERRRSGWSRVPATRLKPLRQMPGP